MELLFFFIFIFIHIGRNLYYNSFFNLGLWFSGFFLLIILIIVSFLGYVLPINQISYWGASVITNLFSEIPIFGSEIVNIIWGGLRVCLSTLKRFYRLHFFFSLLILVIVFIHIIYLHIFGSNNPIGIRSKFNKIIFIIYSIKKDLRIFFFFFFYYFIILHYFPLIFGDDDNFSVRDFSQTPLHIQPEWYFLFAYSILRSIPNKLGGVLSLLFSVLILCFLPFFFLKVKIVYFLLLIN